MRKVKFLFSTILFLTIAALIVSIDLTAAQTPPETPAPTPTVTATPIPPPNPIPTPTPTPPSTVRVIDVYRSGQQEEKNLEVRNSTGIGDIIVIKVSNLQSLVNQAKCLDIDNQKVQNCQEQEIALFLEGRKINGIVPISGAPRPEDETLQFRLQRNAANEEAWTDLLGAPPFFSNRFFKRPTQVSVGLENGYAEPTDVKGEKFKLVRIRGWLFWICLGGLVGLLIGMWRLANKSDILRDSGPKPKLPERKPFSLARCQMAWWFFWVITSFLFIWLITGAYDIITASVLGLIGISASTALGATAIDVGKRKESNGQLSRLKEEKLALDNEIATLGNQINITPPPTDLSQLQQTKATKQAQLDLVKEKIMELENKTSEQKSVNFRNNIFTDGNGSMSFHRFQIFVWTIVLGVIFLYSVWSRLSMPEFSATLLALQGISAGTYLGFKIPEKQF